LLNSHPLHTQDLSFSTTFQALIKIPNILYHPADLQQSFPYIQKLSIIEIPPSKFRTYFLRMDHWSQLSFFPPKSTVLFFTHICRNLRIVTIVISRNTLSGNVAQWKKCVYVSTYYGIVPIRKLALGNIHFICQQLLIQRSLDPWLLILKNLRRIFAFISWRKRFLFSTNWT
jgi:hypothetical protein